MTSEVENILKGQLVRKVEADKAIGVSTANLVPDEKGEVPLSKQSRFDIISEQAPTLQAPSPDALVQAPQVPEAPTLQAPALDALVQAPQVPEAPTLQAPTPDALVQAPQVPEAPTLQAPDAILNDTINDAPVDVVSPAELSEVNLNSIIPNSPAVEEVPKETIEPKTEEQIELPEMPTTILAEEPASVDNNLFVGEVNSNSNVPEQTEIETLPKELDNSSVFQTEENLEKGKKNELDEEKNNKGYEKKLDKILDSLKSLEELNVIIERLDNINKSVIELKDALTERHETIKEEGTLEQLTPSAPEIPSIDTLTSASPSEEVKSPESPVLNESVSNDNPMLNNQSQDASGLEVPYVGPTLNETPTQSPDDIPNIDDSPIKGGMFV